MFESKVNHFIMHFDSVLVFDAPMPSYHRVRRLWFDEEIKLKYWWETPRIHRSSAAQPHCMILLIKIFFLLLLRTFMRDGVWSALRFSVTWKPSIYESAKSILNIIRCFSVLVSAFSTIAAACRVHANRQNINVIICRSGAHMKALRILGEKIKKIMKCKNQ